jgi:hypothetical protein
MAQTKARSSRSSSTSSRSKKAGGSRRATSGSSGRARSRSSGSAKSSGSSGRARGKSSGSSNRSAKSQSQNGSGQNQSSARTVAAKAKGPALAAGAAIVGLAGGLAVKNGRKRHGVLGRVPMPKRLPTPKLKINRPRINSDDALEAIGKAAAQVAHRSHRVGEVATGVQKASEAISNGEH